MHQDFIDQAVKLALENVSDGGKPFGAVIVSEGKVIATGVNEVVKSNDLTEHAEMQAIRRAARDGTQDQLKGAVMYASGHPCPMCLAAMYLAGIEKIYYHNSLQEVEGTSLDVTPIYNQLRKPLEQQTVPLIPMKSTIPQNPVRQWLDKKGD